MKISSTPDPYIKINLILAGLIAFMLLFVAFNPQINYNINIPSNIKIITGQQTASSGLTRGFTEITKLNFKKAQEYNPSSIKIFGFFLLQFIIRIGAIFLSKRSIKRKKLITVDIILFTILFITAFYEMLAGLYHIELPGQ